MGSSHSNCFPGPSSIHIPERSPSRAKRKHLSFFSQNNLSCSSVNSYLNARYGPSQRAVFKRPTSKKAVNLQTDLVTTSEAHSTIKYSSSFINIPQEVQETEMFHAFVMEHPNYHLTSPLDTLRRTDFGRLDQSGEAYVDYMGGALYPERLVRIHSEFLMGSILGNTHSASNSSKLSLKCADDARSAILSHFKASSSEYTVIFTANASAAIKLVAEAYQFRSDSKLVIGADSHNSVHGIREYAKQKGAQTVYIPSTPTGGVDYSTATGILLHNRPQTSTPCLYALTGQSNITNSKTPLSLARYASSIGYNVLLDAAALAPTSIFSLEDSHVDAMAISFYKMFGFPTGVGALIARKDFLKQLQRPWFAGGTVDIVQVPGDIMTRAHQLHEQFEDGTINYLSLPAITEGLKFLSEYISIVPLRLTSLLLYLSSSLASIQHDTTGTPVVKILSRLPSKKLQRIGEQSDVGFILSLIFLDTSGSIVPNSFIEFAATTQNISLRTGCMCNTGGAAAMLGMTTEMQQLYPGVTLADFEATMGHELGVIRMSLGIASNFHDICRVIQFANCLSQSQSRMQLWNQWTESRKGRH